MFCQLLFVGGCHEFFASQRQTGLRDVQPLHLRCHRARHIFRTVRVFENCKRVGVISLGSAVNKCTIAGAQRAQPSSRQVLSGNVPGRRQSQMWGLHCSCKPTPKMGVTKASTEDSRVERGQGSDTLKPAPSRKPPNDPVSYRHAFGTLKWMFYLATSILLVQPGMVAAMYFQVEVSAFSAHMVLCLGAVCLMLTTVMYFMQITAQTHKLAEPANERIASSLAVMSGYILLLDLPPTHRSYMAFIVLSVCLSLNKGSVGEILVWGVQGLRDMVQEAGRATTASLYALLAITHSVWAFILLIFPGLFKKILFQDPVSGNGVDTLVRTVGAAHLPFIALLYMLAADSKQPKLDRRTLRVIHLSLMGFAVAMLSIHLYSIFIAGIAAPLMYSLPITFGTFAPAAIVAYSVLHPAPSSLNK